MEDFLIMNQAGATSDLVSQVITARMLCCAKLCCSLYYFIFKFISTGCSFNELQRQVEAPYMHAADAMVRRAFAFFNSLAKHDEIFRGGPKADRSKLVSIVNALNITAADIADPQKFGGKGPFVPWVF